MNPPAPQAPLQESMRLRTAPPVLPPGWSACLRCGAPLPPGVGAPVSAGCRICEICGHTSGG